MIHIKQKSSNEVNKIYVCQENQARFDIPLKAIGVFDISLKGLD